MAEKNYTRKDHWEIAPTDKWREKWTEVSTSFPGPFPWLIEEVWEQGGDLRESHFNLEILAFPDNLVNNDCKQANQGRDQY